MGAVVGNAAIAIAPPPNSHPPFWRLACFFFIVSTLQTMYNFHVSYSGNEPIQTISPRNDTNGRGITEIARALDYPPSVKEVFINIGSNIDPIMPSIKSGPCARTIAIEPIVGCRIPQHPQLDVVHAAVSSAPGFTSMRVYNFDGQSSSLGIPAAKQSWNDNQERGDGRFVLVPVVSMASILEAIPQTTTILLVMTDMQGYDFEAVSSAGNTLKARVKHLITEVSLDDVYSYNTNNDFCRDWLPYMTDLGYRAAKIWPDHGENFTNIQERCKAQLERMPVRPSINASAGLNERNVHWARLDVPHEPIPRVGNPKNAYSKRFTDEEYAQCQDSSFRRRKGGSKVMVTTGNTNDNTGTRGKVLGQLSF